MRSGLLFVVFLAVLGGAILVGRHETRTTAPVMPRAAADEARRVSAPRSAAEEIEENGVPSVGNIQVLNGCGVNNAGSIVADYLRGQGFDVKNVDNAPTWNYRESIIVSRGSDMRIALRVARALRTDRVVMLREHNSQYDVAVFVGGDFKERLR